MDVTDQINKILNIKDSYQAPQRIMDILYGDKAERDQVFNQMIELFDNDYSFDWFHKYFQDEHADRKKKKQDFTPKSVATLLNRMTVTDSGDTLEVAAGTGGILITRWQEDRMRTNPFEYRPSDYLYQAEDLSDRSIPFLLFNLIVRGMNAVVIHGDSLTKESYGAFFIQNDTDDFFSYSNLNLLPYTEHTEKLLDIKFDEQKYGDIKQSEHIMLRLADPEKFRNQRNNDKRTADLLKLIHTGGI